MNSRTHVESSDQTREIEGASSPSRRRYYVMALAFFPLALVAALLIWGTVKGGGATGGLFVNNSGGFQDIAARPAPDFTFTGFEGEHIGLSGMRGKVVMVDFWASWCPPCRAEAPTIRQVYEDFSGEDVEFVGIDAWESRPGDGQRFVREWQWEHPAGLDPNGTITIEYGVKGLPEKFFIDREGNLVRKWIGPITTIELTEILNELLATGEGAPTTS